jgi:hypothetical protein
MSNDPAQTEMLVGPSSAYWPNKYTCPRCNGAASGMMEGEVDPNTFAGFHVLELEAEEMFRALNGLGLPEEQDCQIENLRTTLNQKVKEIGGHTIPNSKRFCLEWLEMEDGTRLYFGASSHGATVYRIVRKVSFVERVLQEEEVGGNV